MDGAILGVVVRDAFTGWLACYPAAENSADEAHSALNDFVGPKEKVGIFNSDCATELIAAARRLRWRHATSTPGRPATNGAAERAVRAVLEGAIASCSIWPASSMVESGRPAPVFHAQRDVRLRGEILAVRPSLW